MTTATVDAPDLKTAQADFSRALAAQAESQALAADLRERASKGETVDPGKFSDALAAAELDTLVALHAQTVLTAATEADQIHRAESWAGQVAPTMRPLDQSVADAAADVIAAFDRLESAQDLREATRVRLHTESGTAVATGTVVSNAAGVSVNGYPLTSVGSKVAATLAPSIARMLRRSPALGPLAGQLDGLRTNARL